jgi:hypothetical protein
MFLPFLTAGCIWFAMHYRIVYVPNERSIRLLTVEQVAAGRLPGAPTAAPVLPPRVRYVEVEANEP